MEREAPMSEVEDWFRYLQASSADAGQGMVNVLVDILWAFKLRATAGHIYNLAVRLDMYPRNFARYVNISLLLSYGILLFVLFQKTNKSSRKIYVTELH